MIIVHCIEPIISLDNVRVWNFITLHLIILVRYRSESVWDWMYAISHICMTHEVVETADSITKTGSGRGICEIVGCHDGMPWWGAMMGCHDGVPWWGAMMGCHDGVMFSDWWCSRFVMTLCWVVSGDVYFNRLTMKAHRERWSLTTVTCTWHCITTASTEDCPYQYSTTYIVLWVNVAIWYLGGLCRLHPYKQIKLYCMTGANNNDILFSIGIPTISLVYLQDNQKYVHT